MLLKVDIPNTTPSLEAYGVSWDGHERLRWDGDPKPMVSQPQQWNLPRDLGILLNDRKQKAFGFGVIWTSIVNRVKSNFGPKTTSNCEFAYHHPLLLHPCGYSSFRKWKGNLNLLGLYTYSKLFTLTVAGWLEHLKIPNLGSHIRTLRYEAYPRAIGSQDFCWIFLWWSWRKFWHSWMWKPWVKLGRSVVGRSTLSEI